MEESVTYQAILRKGRNQGAVQGSVDEARKMLLRLGQKQFGVPADAASIDYLQSITNVEELEQLSERLLDVRSWQELLSAK